MSLLISIAIFLVGFLVGYLWALFEVWVDGRERAERKQEAADDDD
jgi:hypothetical protein